MTRDELRCLRQDVRSLRAMLLRTHGVVRSGTMTYGLVFVMGSWGLALLAFLWAQAVGVDFLTEAAKQIPVVTVLAWMVFQFLAHLRQLNTERVAEAKVRDESLRSLGDDCHTFQRDIASKIVQVLDRNTDAFVRTVSVLDRMDRVLQEEEERLARETKTR